jgi:hypothetical protein
MSSQLGQENKVTIHKDSIFENILFHMPIERKRQTCLPNHIVALARTANGYHHFLWKIHPISIEIRRLGSSSYNSDIKETQTQIYCQF